MKKILFTLLTLVAAVGLAASIGTAAADDVCSGDKVDVAPGNTSVTVTAPEGYLISQYCVKAGSTNQGNGPEYVNVDPPAASVTFSHSSGKDISHYSVTLVPVPTETETTPTVPEEEEEAPPAEEEAPPAEEEAPPAEEAAPPVEADLAPPNEAAAVPHTR